MAEVMVSPEFVQGFNTGLMLAEQTLTDKLHSLPKETAMELWDILLDVKNEIRSKVQ